MRNNKTQLGNAQNHVQKIHHSLFRCELSVHRIWSRVMAEQIKH